ncbi:Retrovirus-related Pol polyprotein from transposon TNT 1-94 [Bienertia sinuspersici]
MVSNLALFASLKQLSNPIRISLPDGTVNIVKHMGSVHLSSGVFLDHVLYVPQFKHNLLSVGKLLDSNNLFAVFKPNSCYFQDLKTKEIKAAGTRQSGLYKFSSVVPFHSVPSISFDADNVFRVNNTITSHVKPDLHVIHARLGHPSFNTTKHMTVPFIGNKTNCDFSCEACVLGKHHKFPYPVSSSHAVAPFTLIHVDLRGKYSRPTISGAVYFLTILDDHTRNTRTYLLQDKTQVYATIAAFLEYVSTQFNTNVMVIRSDNGTEIIQEQCRLLFALKGIIHQRSLPGNPQQNGRVERKHKHLLEIARTLRIHAGLPYNFWGDCLLAATYLINLLPTSVLNWKSPFEMLFDKPPNYDHLKVIGCFCYPFHKNSDKFAPRSKRCVFLGYPYAQKGYKLYDLDTHKILLSRDVFFVEHEFPYKIQSNSHNLSNSDSVPNSLVNPALDTSTIIQPISTEISPQFVQSTDFQQTASFPISCSPTSSNHAPDNSDTIHSLPHSPNSTQLCPLRVSTRNTQLPSKFKDFVLSMPKQKNTQSTSTESTSFNVYSEPSLAHLASDSLHSLSNVMTSFEPSCYSQAKQYPEWVAAMEKELQALEANDTWELTSLPPGKKAIGCKWVYKTKFKPNGEVERYKGRLVARGDKQISGKDYKHTFSPVAKLTTVRVVLALAAVKRWDIQQLDINNAFLHGFLDEEVYMTPPPRYNKAKAGQVCKLKRSIYGLKQAPRCWNKKLSKFLIDWGFIQSKQDYSMFVFRKHDSFLVVVAYVDGLFNNWQQ